MNVNHNDYFFFNFPFFFCFVIVLTVINKMSDFRVLLNLARVCLLCPKRMAKSFITSNDAQPMIRTMSMV